MSKPHLNEQTGQQNTWGDPLNYDFWVEFESGDKGINSSRKQGVNPFYVIGHECEYELKKGNAKQDGSFWPQKIIRPKLNIASAGGQNVKGYALRYAIDAWIAGKIEKDGILPFSEFCRDYMSEPSAKQQNATGEAIKKEHAGELISEPGAKEEKIEDDLPF